MKINKLSLLYTTFLIAGLCLSACNKPAEQPVASAPAAVEDKHTEISWYDGSIEDAFALAETDRKPLFLYWGAVWCPPCVQIKETVFKHPAFLAKSELFIPVYLDGDTERAQSWGEHFAVAGYPTMIVFSPSGEEITRIPGWIDSTQYLNVLQLALDDLTSTVDLMRQAITDPADLDAEAWSALAFYSWEQANMPEDIPTDAATFRTLAEAAHAAGNEIAWSRMVFHSLYAAALAHEDGGENLADEEKHQAREVLSVIFTNSELVLANSDYLLLYFEDFVPLITDEGNERQKLTKQWVAAMQTLREAPQLSGAEHIASWYPQIEGFWLNNPETEKLPTELEHQIIAYIDDVEGATTGEARQAVVNTSYQMLEEIKRNDLARSLLLAEVGKSYAPYYFMSSLGDLEEEEGHPVEAVGWHRQAYENAVGEATRFQWGYQYVDSMTRLTPEQSDRIVNTSQTLLWEFANQENVLTGRNFGRLQRLLTSLHDWQEATGSGKDHTAGLEDFYASLKNLCSGSNLTGESGEHCRELQQANFSGPFEF